MIDEKSTLLNSSVLRDRKTQLYPGQDFSSQVLPCCDLFEQIQDQGNQHKNEDQKQTTIQYVFQPG